jgi:hypothetical protein
MNAFHVMMVYIVVWIVCDMYAMWMRCRVTDCNLGGLKGALSPCRVTERELCGDKGCASICIVIDKN